MYTYELGIIDDFRLFHDFKKLTFDTLQSNTQDGRDYDKILKEVIFNLAKHTCWEGDGDFDIIPLLNLDQMYHPGYGVIVKQSNNGSTFMVSNIPAYGFEELRVDNIRKK